MEAKDLEAMARTAGDRGAHMARSRAYRSMLRTALKGLLHVDYVADSVLGEVMDYARDAVSRGHRTAAFVAWSRGLRDGSVAPGTPSPSAVARVRVPE